MCYILYISWISPTRSQTMRELQSLLQSAGEQISKDDIARGISKDTVTHRYKLFLQEEGIKKDGTSTDDVISNLADAFKNKS